MNVMEQAQAIRTAIDAAASVLADADAVNCKALYKQWADLVREGTVVEKGFRFLNGEDLYRIEQASYAFVAHYAPGAIGTESLFSRVDEVHAGTGDGPIPYEGNMALEEGLYYTQGGIVYRCTWSTGIPVYHPLNELVGLYVEVVS